MADIIVSDRENFHSVTFCSEKPKELYVNDWGYHKTPSEHVWGPTIRPYYLIHLVESGKGFLEHDGTVTELKAGDAFVIRPWEVNLYRADAKEPWTYYWISFYGSLSDKFMKNFHSHIVFNYSTSGLMALKTAVNNDAYTDSIGNLYVLFSVINGLKSSIKNPQEDVLDLALKYIENNYFSISNMSELASVLGFSRAYFSTEFKKRFGKTPYNYLLKVRLTHAKEYLMNSQLSVTEIAFAVGFSSIERFSEMFIKYEGITPSNFRKKMRIE